MTDHKKEIERRGFMKSGLWATAGAVVLGGGAAHGAEVEMELADRMIVEHDCAKLVNRFYHLFNREPSLVATSDIFTKDAVLDFGWNQLGPGPDAIQEGLIEYAKEVQEEGIIALNTASNVVIEVTDKTHAKGISNDTMWRHIYGDSKGGLPAPVPLPTYLGYWTDAFTREDGQWKFSRRAITYTFDQQRWSEPSASNYPEKLITTHEEWRRQVDEETN